MCTSRGGVIRGGFKGRYSVVNTKRNNLHPWDLGLSVIVAVSGSEQADSHTAPEITCVCSRLHVEVGHLQKVGVASRDYSRATNKPAIANHIVRSYLVSRWGREIADDTKPPRHPAVA